jgi:hypothetical protein
MTVKRAGRYNVYKQSSYVLLSARRDSDVIILFVGLLNRFAIPKLFNIGDDRFIELSSQRVHSFKIINGILQYKKKKVNKCDGSTSRFAVRGIKFDIAVAIAEVV